jgi:hypothetical protein
VIKLLDDTWLIADWAGFIAIPPDSIDRTVVAPGIIVDVIHVEQHKIIVRQDGTLVSHGPVLVTDCVSLSDKIVS